MAKAAALTPIPTIESPSDVSINVATTAGRASVVGTFVPDSGAVPRQIGVDRKALSALGFEGRIGQAIALPKGSGPVTVAVGIGGKGIDANGVRNAAAAFARAAGANTIVALSLSGAESVDDAAAAQAIVEGALLARYRFRAYKQAPGTPPLKSLTIVASANRAAAVKRGIARGKATARAAKLARDLANSPHNLLSATTMGNIANRMGKAAGLKVELFDKNALIRLGCGGLLGVNAGSIEQPRMIKLTYTPKSGGTRGKKPPSLALVGKGIMYDSGGLALKPGDEVHAAMKNDMSGAAAILAAMLALPELDCPTSVTGFLMCTDNIPSATAMALGDVITIYGGKTVEVINTDAEGRLVMADALVLATEESHDAIVDIATLTGACMRALGTQMAGVMGNNQAVVDQVRAAADNTDEPVWQLPLAERYRGENSSTIADLRNIGITSNGGALHAGLFLSEFVANVPWAHIDIAGTALSHSDTLWYTPGCSGFGTRLLIDLALNFTPPS